MRRVRPGGWCWIALAAGVTAMDIALIENGKDTMSTVFGDALRHPIRRWPVIAAWALLTLHLFGNTLPVKLKWLKRLDPIAFVATTLTRR